MGKFQKFSILSLTCLFMAGFWSHAAQAACTAPAGAAGEIVYNTSAKIVQYCSGTNWIATGKGPGTGSGCLTPAGVEGEMVFNGTTRTMQFCDGKDWAGMGKANAVNPNTTDTASMSPMGATLSGLGKWYGAVRGNNNKIYGIPRLATNILIIDPATGTATSSNMGADLTGGGKWHNAVMGPNGKIYGIPFDSTDILIIDPATGTATRSNMGADLTGNGKWDGGVLAPNGKIYAIPRNAFDILVIDPVAGTATRNAMGANLSGSDKWHGGALGNDGKIYGIPRDSTNILIIDPVAGTATRSAMGATLSGSAKWMTGFTASNGRIYGIPSNATDILIIDPAAGTATRSTMGATLTGSTKWNSGVMGPNGKIYGIPRAAADILIIDPVAGTATRSAMGATFVGSEKWIGAAIDDSNAIYAVPYDTNTILKIQLGGICANPGGSAGELVFNSSSSVLQYCNGSVWVGLNKANPPPVDCTGTVPVGSLCFDGTVYAGMSPDGNIKMFATLADGGGHPWNTGNSANYVDVAGLTNCTTGAQASCRTGKDNTPILAAADSQSTGGFEPHMAAQYCENLVSNGYSDWYLPAIDELGVLYTNRNEGRFTGTYNVTGAFPSSLYWSSSEYSQVGAMQINFGTGSGHPFNASANVDKRWPFSVRCVRKNTPDPLAVGLIGHWKFDEGTGGTTADSSGNGNTGTLINMNTSTAWVAGRNGTALEFDGVNDVVSAGSASILDNLTVASGCAWTRRSVIGNGMFPAIFDKSGDSTGFNGWNFYYNKYNVVNEGGTYPRFGYYSGSADYKEQDPSIPFNGTWQHICFSWNGTDSTAGIRLYYNGAFTSTSTSVGDGATLNDAAFSLGIGGQAAGLSIEQFYTGRLDDLRLYNRALSDAEIMQIYNADGGAVTPPPEPQNCPNAGDTCTNGMIYAGTYNGNKIYVAANDAPTTLAWGPYQDAVTETGMGLCDTSPYTGGSCETGRENTQLLITLPLDYPAAEYCASLNAHGESTGWYLPARNELNMIYVNLKENKAAGTLNFQNSDYWSSSEVSRIWSFRQNFQYGWQSAPNNDNLHRVRCAWR